MKPRLARAFMPPGATTVERSKLERTAETQGEAPAKKKQRETRRKQRAAAIGRTCGASAG